MDIAKEHDKIVQYLRNVRRNCPDVLMIPNDAEHLFDRTLDLLCTYKHHWRQLPGPGVLIAIHGESDNLVEVSGPCWDSGRLADQGEYDAYGATNQQFLIVDADLNILARVYATYNEWGAWMFALAQPGAENRPLLDDVYGTTTACDESEHSTLLTVHAPAGAFFVTVEDRREIAGLRAVEGLEE